MKLVTATVTATAALIFATSSAAFAQGPSEIAPAPQVAAASSAAPHNEDWRNVSHINGTPVKVGERNAYLYEQKKFNVSSNPIGWMVGFYGLSGSYAVSDHVALRGDVDFYSFDQTRGYELGLSAPIYLKRTYSGIFIEPGVAVRGLRDVSNYDCYDCSYYGETPDPTTDVIYGPEMMVGYHATFDSGLNASVAFGILRNLNPQRSEYGDGVEPTGYFRVGYAF